MSAISRWAAIALAGVVVVSLGCATRTHSLVDVSFGMTRDEVQEAIGRPDSVRLGGMRAAGEQKIEIWEYHMYDQGLDEGLSSIAGVGSPNVSYWLYFEDGTLFRWGPAGAQQPLPVR